MDKLSRADEVFEQTGTALPKARMGRTLRKLAHLQQEALRFSAIGGPQHDRRASLWYHQILDGRAARQGAHSEKGATEMALQVRAYNMTCVMNPAMKVPR
ncbi:MAG: hypothetical protein ABJL72_06115 [Roseobacter sp.]